MKFSVIDLSIAIEVGLLNHLVNLLVCQLLPHLGHHIPQLCRGDEAIAVLVKDTKCVISVLLAGAVRHLPGHLVDELRELYSAVAIGVLRVNIVNEGNSGPHPHTP